MSQGGKANYNGHAAEDVIATMIAGKGLVFRRQVRLCDSIFGTPVFTDFHLPVAPGFPDGLCIESKWQQTGGSVDEKLPYLVANIRERFPCPVVVVLHGGGYRPGAEAWLRAQVGGNLVAVYGLEGLLKWINASW